MSTTHQLPPAPKFPQTKKFEDAELDYVPLLEFARYLRENNIDPSGMKHEQLERTIFAYLDVDYDSYWAEQAEREHILESL